MFMLLLMFICIPLFKTLDKRKTRISLAFCYIFYVTLC
uniref:Uncharacterized protein n=1 Tax=Anguilla anguilla TaxID=7936 RepID=A0A0E9WYW3_ANGAN